MAIAADRLDCHLLRKGRISALLHGAELRNLKIDGSEVLRGIYVTVRDESWDTPPLSDLHVEIEESPESIVIRASAEQRSSTVLVSWRIVAILNEDGAASYSARIVAGASFAFNRIGLCILHPPETCAGRPYRAVGGAVESRGELPKAIAPQRIEGGEIHPMFAAFDRLQIDVRGVGPCEHVLHGDLFEMEDQRNWSDGSLKTYCTPLSRPRPQWASPGAKVEQAVELIPPPADRRAGRTSTCCVDEVLLGGLLESRLPPIGLGMGEALSRGAGPSIQALGLDHIRVDLRQPDRFRQCLAQAAADAQAASCPVALALHLGAQAERELDLLEELLGEMALPIGRVLVFSSQQPSSVGPLVRRARARLGHLTTTAAFAGGTDRWFAELNRERPEPSAMDALAWAISPTVHGDDELTMVDAIDAQRDQLETARAFADALQLVPGPITLRPRYNPNAPDALHQMLDPPRSSIDARQGSWFAAAWTAGSIQALALGGASAATYFETAGARGIVSADGSILTPCYHVIASAARWRSRRLVSARSSNPLAARALLVCSESGQGGEGFVFNLTREARKVRIGPFDGDRVQLWALQPAERRQVCVQDGFTELELEPYEILRLSGAPADLRPDLALETR